MALPTVADLKTHLNIPLTDTSDDDELQEVLDAAIEVAEGVVGPMSAVPVSETHWNVSSGVLLLRRAPVVGLVSVSSRYGATATELTLSDYELDAATGIVRVAAGGIFSGTFVVTYTTGWSDLPASIRLGVLIVAAHLWETQRRPGFTSALPAGFGGADGVPDSTLITGRGFAIPARAEELFARYRPASGVA